MGVKRKKKNPDSESFSFWRIKKKLKPNTNPKQEFGKSESDKWGNLLAFFV